jgi:DNA-binding HxlR family transcriptional regulator
MTITTKQALNHPVRKTIVAILMAQRTRRATFVSLRHALGGLHQQKVANHCRILLRLDFIAVKKYGKPKPRSVFRLLPRGELRLKEAAINGIKLDERLPPP